MQCRFVKWPAMVAEGGIPVARADSRQNLGIRSLSPPVHLTKVLVPLCKTLPVSIIRMF